MTTLLPYFLACVPGTSIIYISCAVLLPIKSRNSYHVGNCYADSSRSQSYGCICKCDSIFRCGEILQCLVIIIPFTLLHLAVLFIMPVLMTQLTSLTTIHPTTSMRCTFFLGQYTYSLLCLFSRLIYNDCY